MLIKADPSKVTRTPEEYFAYLITEARRLFAEEGADAAIAWLLRCDIETVKSVC